MGSVLQLGFPGNSTFDEPRVEPRALQMLLSDNENTVESRRVGRPMGGLQFLSQSINSVFQFSYLFLHVSELCIPTQHGAPPDASSNEMLSSPGKAWQRRNGCHARTLLPKKCLR
jgi:hypothetical protein